MCAKSPGARQASLVQSELQVAALDDPQTLQAVGNLGDVVCSALGPRGHLKVIHNNIGGHVTVTSTASRLLASISFSNPIVKLIVAAAQGHIQLYHDGGLFTIALATSLIRNSLKAVIHRRLLMDFNAVILQNGIEILQGDFSCKTELDFRSSNDMLKLVKSIMRSKGGCGMFPVDLEYMSSLMLRTFLSACPHGDEASQIVYLTVEGLPLRESTLFAGLLIEGPHMTSRKVSQWKLPGREGSAILVAMFTMSLSGDAEESADAVYDMDEDVDLMSGMLRNLMERMDQLIHLGVRLVCCQRVIHPRIKSFLQQNHITAFDRLGKVNIHALHKLAGGQLIGSLSVALNKALLGTLDNASATSLNQRVYIHLTREAAKVSTLLLGHRTEETLQELKTACVTCENILKMSLQDSRVLGGGGCWQSHLLASISHMVVQDKQKLMNQLKCTSSQVDTALDIFISSMRATITALHSNADHMTDTANQHHWIISNCNGQYDSSMSASTCECGFVVKTDELKMAPLTDIKYTNANDRLETSAECTFQVIDSFPAMLNAFQTAVSVSNMVLGIENIILDSN